LIYIIHDVNTSVLNVRDRENDDEGVQLSAGRDASGAVHNLHKEHRIAHFSPLIFIPSLYLSHFQVFENLSRLRSHLISPDQTSSIFIMQTALVLLASLAMATAGPIASTKSVAPACGALTAVCCNGITTPVNVLDDSCIRYASCHSIP
jgi:hypothetical protein